MLHPVSSATVRLADTVFERMANAIIDESLAPGQRLRDGELAQSMGVSRMPVREALQRLERIGLVEMSPSRFTRVTIVTPEMAQGTLEFAGYYASSTIRMACLRMSTQQRTEATSAIDAIIADVKNHASPLAARRAFHRMILDIAANPFVDTISRDTDIALARNLQYVKLPLSDPNELVDSYEALSRALTAGDTDAAERIVRSQFAL
ncbi:GntR family transcriptional regulator [Microbacterium amylolyticum]|uniref:DNA-binding GntR family transcriptional regulator n=1 Tax=Microbacterium amylolyticum TaxID=936337 RepID=A0ABS4ZF67_9MICO|nr:GntR family transcriptional regulator [Microbacterium amylolyticum]MBP2435909.1 DNA-binding GntR family transcriptional regulator [Microbacterium amylolyticum]